MVGGILMCIFFLSVPSKGESNLCPEWMSAVETPVVTMDTAPFVYVHDTRDPRSSSASVAMVGSMPYGARRRTGPRRIQPLDGHDSCGSDHGVSFLGGCWEPAQYRGKEKKKSDGLC